MRHVRYMYLLVCCFVPLSVGAQEVPPVLRLTPVVKVWAEPEFRDEALRGCRYWEPAVRCEPAESQASADVAIIASPRRCPKYPELAEMFGWAKSGILDHFARRRPGCTATRPIAESENYILGYVCPHCITVFPDCFAAGSEIAKQLGLAPGDLWRTLAHEFGHHFGIRFHVPKACDDPCVDYTTHTDGGKICGPSIMNVQKERHNRMTPMDLRAFEVREPFYWLEPAAH